MAVGESGTAVFVWEQGSRYARPPSDRVYARSMADSGALGPAVGVSARGERLLLPTPRVAVAADGRALIVWTQGFNSYRVRARRLSATGTPGEIIDVSGAAAGYPEPEPRVAIDPGANAIVTWRRDTTVYARSLSASGMLGPSVGLSSADAYASGAEVGVTPDGRAVFAWWSSVDRHRNGVIQARTRSATGTLGPIATLTDPSEGSTVPQLAVAANARATVTWEIGHGLGRTFRARAATGP
jgi:hypothetical protein